MLEHCEHGDLRKLLDAKDKVLCIEQKYLILMDIAQVIALPSTPRRRFSSWPAFTHFVTRVANRGCSISTVKISSIAT